MIRQSRSNRRRGFWLIELMMVIGLLAAFGMVSIVVFRMSSRATFTAGQTLEAAQRFDQAVRMLRTDVMGSSSIKADGASSVELQSPDGPVVWQIRPDGWLIRRQGRDETRWERMPADLRFETGAARLTVIVPTAGGAEDRLTLTSAVMSAKEGK